MSVYLFNRYIQAGQCTQLCKEKAQTSGIFLFRRWNNSRRLTNGVVGGIFVPSGMFFPAALAAEKGRVGN